MRADAQKNFEQLLSAARAVFLEQGAEASLRDIARRAGVGLGTLYRHFPTREALLETLLRDGFEDFAKRAEELGSALPPDEALVTWLREMVTMTHSHRGLTTAMMASIEDPDSALHASCVKLKSAGARLLKTAQQKGKARQDMNGADLFAMIAALAWLADQPAGVPRSKNLFTIITSAILTSPK